MEKDQLPYYVNPRINQLYIRDSSGKESSPWTVDAKPQLMFIDGWKLFVINKA